MAPRNVAINGLGRIDGLSVWKHPRLGTPRTLAKSRLTLRVAWTMPEAFNIVHLNDITPAESIAYLIKYDSIHGTWGPSVKVEGEYIVISDGDRVVRASVTQKAAPSENLVYTTILTRLMEDGTVLCHLRYQPFFSQLEAFRLTPVPPRNLDMTYCTEHTCFLSDSRGVKEIDSQVNSIRVVAQQWHMHEIHRRSEDGRKQVSQIDYAACNIEVVLECTGVHLTRNTLQPYFDKGVKKIVVSAPVKEPSDPVLNIVVGCNEKLYNPAKDHIVTAASCTTNCLAPVVKVMHEQFGIVKGAITTIHCVTNTQTIIDAPNHKKSDLRRARSGLMNLAPTSTGSATAIALIFPELKGKLNGHAVRVPLTNSSITDAVFVLEKQTTAEEVNNALSKASETYLKNILQVEQQPLVSMDFVNNPNSSIVDAPSTMVIDGNMVKIYAWYDNEWGYSCRMADIGKMVIEQM